MHTRLEAAAIREIAHAWAHLNWRFLGEALRAPLFELGDGLNTLGVWRRRGRTITLARALVFERSWDAVLEVLKHEMAHQYADEVLLAVDEPAHGPAFAHACDRLGIEAVASGPISGGTSDDPRGRVFDRIRKLLALAASPNRHEAEAATRKARRLMLVHNLESAPTGRTYGWRAIGPVRARFSPHEKILGGLLGEHFFVSPVLVPSFVATEGRQGKRLEISGTPENLDIAEYVYDFLTATAERLWDGHRGARGLGSDRDRRRFLAGVMQGFHEKLLDERKLEQQEGLVWVRDPGLDGYVGRRHGRTVRRSGKFDASSGFAEGREAGRGIVLHRGVSAEPAARGLTIGRER